MRVHLFFFYAGIILMPFIGTLDVAKKILFPFGSGLFLCASIGALMWILFYRGKIQLPPRHFFLFLILFVAIYFLSAMWNVQKMFLFNWQGVQGIHRFLLSTGFWGLNFILLLYMYNSYLSDRKSRKRINKYLLISFFLSALCGIVELMAQFDGGAAVLLAAADSLYRGETPRQLFRVQAFASEPSQYSGYLAIICPLLLFKFFQSKNFFFYFVMLLIFAVLLVATYSRTGYFIILAEFILFLCFFRKEIPRYRLLSFTFVSGVFLVGVTLLFNSLTDIDYTRALQVFDTILSAEESLSNASNVARFGATLAALEIFQDHFVLGIGYDQFAFYAADYYPSWAYTSPEITSWATNYTGRADWPPAFNYYVRLLAELGVFGALVWIFLLYCIWHYGWQTMLQKEENEYLKLYLIMFFGQVLTLFNTSDISAINIFIAAVLLAEMKRLRSQEE